MKQVINPFDYATHILQSLKSGILLTTMADGKINIMTIAWGSLGIDWNIPIFTTLVRLNRHSRLYLDKNPQFTINVPVGEVDRRILAVAGTKSGRDMDKVTALGLHLEEPDKISVPGIKELPLTLECSVIYRQPQEPSLIPEDIRKSYHPQHIDSYAPGINKDYHIAYYGAIVSAYIIS